MSKKIAGVTRLLSREEFKTMVFDRDNHTCVFCDKPAVDAHHIIDRALFSDGGYYLNNGASVCEQHHWACEKTDISVEDVRLACGITSIIVPEGVDSTLSYDKWLNVINSDGSRTRGPIFYQDNVHKALGDKNWRLTWV